LFLSQVHNTASTESLLQGLDFLSRSIEKKSASLKVLVESNFERFVRAKATIDNVYKEMRNQGLEPEPSPQAGSHRRGHSRQLSRSSQHFRRTSGPFSPTFGGQDTPPPNEKRKNALIKESEYGVLPIKGPLLEIAIKAEEVWGPALGGREKEDSLKAVLGCVEKHRRLFEVGTSISNCIKRKDNEALVEEYVKARNYANDAKAIVDTAIQNRTALSDADVHQVIVTARMWADVEEQIEDFKRDVWRRLTGTHLTRTPAGEEHKTEEHMELISILLELGVPETDNPIWYWLVSRYDHLKGKMTATFERSRVEIEILRRRLANGEKPTSSQLATHLRTATADGRLSSTSSIDSPKVVEVWEHIYASMNALLSTQGGVLGEIVEYWEAAQSFIEERAQRTLPSGIDGRSRKHHRLSVKGVNDLRTGALELVNMLRDDLYSFFTEPPIEDLSLLLSPIPPTPETPTPITPKSASLAPFSDTKFRFDPNNVPPPSPRKGESWEKYGFWPPHANSISGVHYLSKILVLIGTAATELASLSFMRDGNRSADSLKLFVSGIRERFLQATCTAWNEDAGHCRVLEDWTRAPERPDLTNMPARFMNFEGFLLSNVQKILYVSEATRRPDSPEIIIPPSSKLLAIVRSQFVSSIYASLTAMVENAEQPSMLDDDWKGDVDGLSVPEQNGAVAEGENSLLNASSKVLIDSSPSTLVL
jgi:exocyst complex component 2